MRILSSKIKRLCFGFRYIILFCLAYADSSFEIANGMLLKTPVFEAKVGTNFEDLNVGLSLSSEKITPEFPLTLKTGNLNASGILSKMKQPLLSGLGSPFSCGDSSVSGISASLPSYTAYSKPFSSFFQFGYKPKQKYIPHLFANCWYSKEEQMFASSVYSSSSFLKNNIKIKSAFCVGQFPYSENYSSYWQPNDVYYKQGEHFVCSFSNSIELWRTFLYFCLCSFESPFGTIQNSYRADFKYSGKHFIYGISGAYNGDKTLSASDEKIKESLQLRGNLQYKDTLRLKLPLFWKFGFTTFGNIRLAETEQQIKAAIGVQFRYGITSLSLTSGTNCLLDTENIDYPIFSLDSYNFKSILNFSFPYVATSFTLGATFTPKANEDSINQKYSGKIQVYNSGKIKFNSSTTYTFSIKDDLMSTQKMAIAFGLDFKRTFFSYSIKISADIDI